ncbi:membrane protein [Desulfuromonas versatilis]|uniref:Membrane protein n=1 Tax=Desulfuromonas versatilis TaxID=2802975 RepID=A0ABM8HRD5_9BACT|nr:DUF2270 domain-containing protein [Desulfuromonas versatilis]BCR03493.1 membrane protein [Desulfuromonas versatilis]
MVEERRENRQLSTGETITALMHYYRGEVTRSLAWRERLDRTTNWSVGTTAAFLGFGFSHPEIIHAFFLFGLAIAYILLYVESRRYRFFDAYEYRVKLIHQNFVADVLLERMDSETASRWRQALAKDLLHPRYKMTLVQAMGRRIYANYIFLFVVLVAGWLLKMLLHPQPAHTWGQFLEQAGAGVIPGWVTLLFIFAFLLHLVVLMRIGRKAKGGEETLILGARPDEERQSD